MRVFWMLAIVAGAATPTASSACGFDFMPGFMGHGYQPVVTEAEQQAIREQAVADARRAFLARYRLEAEPGAPSPPIPAGGQSAAAVVAQPAPPLDEPR
jgi:hypothetical protein